MKNPSLKKSDLIAVRVSPKERTIIEANAAMNDLTISNFIRTVAIHTKEVRTNLKTERIEDSIFDFEEHMGHGNLK